MEKHCELVVKIIGPGDENKKKELTEKVLRALKVAGERSLGDLQASVTIKEK